ncbi:MAG: SpaA isopeptide-forming pilin-related protein, partial [Clostridia bacterium]
DQVIFTVNGAETADREVILKNTPFHVAVLKQDAQGKALAGAKLALYEGNHPDGTDMSALTALEAWESAAAAHVIAVPLAYGKTYTIHELQSPNGYACARNLVFTVDAATLASAVTDASGAKLLTYSMVDAPITAEIAKLDAQTKLPLAGVTLELRCAQDASYLVTWTTSDTLTAQTVQGLIVGNSYTITEVGVPYGYSQALPITFTVQRDGTLRDGAGNLIANNRVEMLNSKTNRTVFTVTKVWDDHNVLNLTHPTITVRLTAKLAKDAAFTDALNANGQPMEAELNEQNGWKHVFSDLPATDKDGNAYAYSAYEVQTPAGYTKQELLAADGLSLTIINHFNFLHGTFCKRELTGVGELAGAVLELTNAQGTVLATFTSGTQPTLLDTALLENGQSYTLTETVAPEGYVLNTEAITFLVEKNADESLRFTVTGGTNVGFVENGTTIVMKDRPQDLSILKTDANGNALSGASLRLYEIDQSGAQVGADIDAWVSGSAAHTISAAKVAVGHQYMLEEVNAPAEYLLAAPIAFILEKDAQTGGLRLRQIGVGGVVNGMTVTMADRLIERTRLDVEKRWEEYGSAAFTHPQITAQLLRKLASEPDTSYAEVLGQSVTLGESNQWRASFENLPASTPAGEAYAYTARETVVPDGYAAAYTQTGTQITITNTTKTVDGRFSKQTLTGSAELPGAELQIVDAAKHVIASWTSAATPYLLPTKLLTIGETYTLEEIKAPDGYSLAQSISFTVTRKGDQVIFTVNGAETADREVMMKDAQTKVTVRKLDRIGGNGVSGAELRLADLTDPTAAPVSWTTDGQDQLFVGKLIAGHSYQLSEVQTPAGYIPAAPITFTVDEKGETGYAGNLIPMIDIPMRAEVLKQDEANRPLSGAKLALYEGNYPTGADMSALTPLEQWDSNASAHVIATLLTYGKTYTVHELVPPDGYACAPNLVFTVDAATLDAITADGASGIKTLSYTMVDAPITAEIAKLDAATSLALAGVTLELRCAQDASYLVTWTTSDSLTVQTVQGLIVGNTYTLTETGVPYGYRQALPITFTVQRDGTLRSADGHLIANNRVEMLNSQTNRTFFTVYKVWDDRNVPELTHDPITVRLTCKLESDTAGAYTDCLDANGQPMEAQLNKSNGWQHVFSDLPLTDKDGGVYAYSAYEVSVPAGYTKLEERAKDGQSLTITNRYNYILGTFSKRDITGTEELAGAQMEMYDHRNNVRVMFVSGTQPTLLSSLLLTVGGTYTLTEHVAPEGYALNTQAIDFRVEENPDGSFKFVITGGAEQGLVENGTTAVMLDQPLDVTVLKKDAAGNPLAGATLALYEGADAAGQLIATWISTDKPMPIRTLATQSGYLFKRGATYTLREIAVPDGYAPAADVTFTFAAETEVSVQPVEMTDRDLSILIRKVDENGKPVAGAQLALYLAPISAASQPIEEWITADSAHALAAKLAYGQTYVLRERNVPGGYVHADDITFTLNEEFLASSGQQTGEAITVGLSMTDEHTRVRILKVDEQTGLPLAGATLALYEGTSAAGTLLDTWVTTTDAREITGVLKVGHTYFLTETQAPSGYSVSVSYIFTLKQADAVSTPLTITMRDANIYRFRKVDNDDGGILAGARLAILEGNKTIATWTTTGDDYELIGTLQVGHHYTLRELSPPAGYQLAADVHFSVNADGKLVYGTNANGTKAVGFIEIRDVPEVPVPPPVPPTTTLDVQKEWRDQDDVLGKRPTELKLHLFRKLTNEANYPTAPYMTVTMRPAQDKANTWRFTFNDLERYNDQGVYYQYMVREEEVAGYEVRYANNGRSIINAIPEEDIPPTPTPTLPVITPTPAPTAPAPAGVKFLNGEWVYIDENGVPLGLVPQTGDDTSWLLWGLAIALPLLLASIAAIELRRRKKKAALESHHTNG